MIETGALLDLVRLIVGITILGYASYTDIKTRRAANILWIIMGVIGVILILIQFFTTRFTNIYYLIFIPIMIALMYGLFQLRLIFGGADAKALMALAILLPVQPLIEQFPLWGRSIMPGSWTIFSNSVAIFLVIPLSLLLYNLIKRNVEFPYCFLGYKMSVEKAKQTFVWPLETIQDGKRKFAYMPKDYDADDELIEFEKQGITEIWVTPKIPFMIPLFVGYIVTFILGDILFSIMQSFI